MRDDVLAWLQRPGPRSKAEAEALAIRLFHHQRANSPSYAAMTSSGGAPPDPQGWEEIPALPVSLFKELPIRSFAGAPGRIFHTSGTTGSVRGEHALLDTSVYDAAAWRHFSERCAAVPASVVSLCPPPTGDSSLGHMVGHFAARLGAPLLQLFHSAEEGLPADALARIAAPCFLATTAFSLDALLAQPGRAELGPESLVMVTGGFKGRRVRLDSAALYAAIGERLGAPRVVGEYGMTELCSQLWTAPAPAGAVPGPFLAPPWLHVYTVDARTGEPAPRGILRFVDVANTDSAVAVETLDLGHVERVAGEPDRVWLEGRAAGAELRGCSLRAEDLRRG